MGASADWFHDAGWGLFMHFLAAPASGGPADFGVDEWNRQVDEFDVERLATQVAEVGAGYFFLTIGQNTGHYCSPNATYDSLVGRRPSRLARRDLVADLARALAPRGIRTMVYLPSHAPAHDREAISRLRCTPPWEAPRWSYAPDAYSPAEAARTDERVSEFQRNWEAIVREWSERWGPSVGGWWFDGCYYADQMYRHADPPNFASFAAAARAGNPASLVAFNPGVKCPVIRWSDAEDYTAGEISECLPVSLGRRPKTRFVDGAQYHVLSFLGDWWGRGPLRFPDELIVGFTKHVNAVGGVVTWDVPVGPRGTLDEATTRQLAALRQATR
jgi:hypothetical protein